MPHTIFTRLQKYQQSDRYNTNVDGSGTDLWLPGETLTLDSFTATDRIKVVTEHGISVSTGEI